MTTPDSTTDRLAEAPAPLTNEQVANFAELIDMHRQYGPALSIEGEAQLLVEVLRLRALTAQLQERLDTAEGRLATIDSIHIPRPRVAPATAEHPGHCQNCGEQWPCSTKRATGTVPEMPRPPAQEADAEYMVVIPSLCGNPTDYRMSYSSDRVRKSTREAAIAHGLEVEGHDDWLIAIVVGDKLTGLAWQHEDRDDAEEVEEAAAALGLTAAFAMPIPAAQEPASGPETVWTGSGRGTGVAETQASDG